VPRRGPAVRTFKAFICRAGEPYFFKKGEPYFFKKKEWTRTRRNCHETDERQ
jgi:hypothetical protein